MFKKIIIALFLACLLATPLLVLADEYGLDTTAGKAGLTTHTDLPTMAGTVIGVALSLAGVIFFGLMIYAGFLWMTAQGKEEQAKKALDTIIACIIGLVIILAAYAITRFIFNSAGVGSVATSTTQ